MEPVGFGFFVNIKYENFMDYFSFFSCIGHSLNNCKRNEQAQGKDPI